MTEPPKTKDLIVLVPDADMEYAIQALLPRHQALDIRPVTFDIRRHMQRDAGCRSDCHNFLRLFLNDYQCALVLFDHEGCGREQMTRLELETDVEGRLKANGWGDRCAVIVISPELEAWVWSDSPVVDEALGWRDRTPSMRDWLQSKTAIWHPHHSKPKQPKEAMESALRTVRKQKSPRLYEYLGKSVAVDRCKDSSFSKFKKVLRQWFGV
jgi:hypothetical protein